MITKLGGKPHHLIQYYIKYYEKSPPAFHFLTHQEHLFFSGFVRPQIIGSVKTHTDENPLFVLRQNRGSRLYNRFLLHTNITALCFCVIYNWNIIKHLLRIYR